MLKPYRRSVSRQIQILFQPESLSGLSDAQLLERFLAGRDESSELAFTALVERHGPMVLGVCRRILADSHDRRCLSSDFPDPGRKARSVRVEGSIGRWLYGVAMRVASARQGAARTGARRARRAVLRSWSLPRASRRPSRPTCETSWLQSWASCRSDRRCPLSFATWKG